MAVAGNLVGYWIGRKAGPPIFERPDSRIFKQEYVDKTIAFFDKYGARAIVLARFVPIVRTFITVIAGVGKMDFRRYALYSSIGGVLWGTGRHVARLLPRRLRVRQRQHRDHADRDRAGLGAPGRVRVAPRRSRAGATPATTSRTSASRCSARTSPAPTEPFPRPAVPARAGWQSRPMTARECLRSRPRPGRGARPGLARVHARPAGAATSRHRRVAESVRAPPCRTVRPIPPRWSTSWPRWSSPA